MLEIDQLAADLYRLGDRSATVLRKYVIIVVGLSADYEVEVRMLKNNPTCCDKTEIERIVGNRYKRLLKQQHDSKALLASGSITTVDRGENRRDRKTDSRATASTAGGRVTALRIASARRKTSKIRRYPRKQEGRR